MMQHASLTRARWAAFSLDQQVLMIGNEMNRAGKLLAERDRERLRHSYERVLQLVDLTIEVDARRSLRREVLRWRDLIAALYAAPEADPAAHAAAFRCLLRFTPEASKQLGALQALSASTAGRPASSA